MAAWLGHLGGFLMFTLIVVLFIYFLWDANIVKDSKKLVSFGQLAVFVAVIGLVQLMIGALMFNFCKGEASAFDLCKIWNTNSISQVVSFCKGEQFDFSIQEGIFPLYPLLVHIGGKFLFQQYDAVMLYLNFLIAILFTFGMHLLVAEWTQEKVEDVKKEITVLLLLPGIFFLFLPTIVNLSLCLGVFSIYFMKKEKKVLAAIFVFLGMLTHYFGLIFLIVFLGMLLTKGYKNGCYFFTYLLGIVICGMLSMGMEWKFTSEQIMILYPLIVFMMCLAKIKKIAVDDRMISIGAGIFDGMMMYLVILSV